MEGGLTLNNGIVISAVWTKTIRDLRWQLLLSGVLLFIFAWLFVWLNSLLKLGLWTTFLEMLPDFVQKLMPIPPSQLVTTTGRISIAFVHIVPMVIFLGWAFVRGAELVSGELESGRFEVLLTLPVSRWVWVAVPCLATLLGGLLLGGVFLLGLELGRLTVEFPQPLNTARFPQAGLNLALMAFAMAGITAVFSALLRHRLKAITAGGMVFVLSLILKLVAQLWPAGQILRYLTFLTLYEPQVLIFSPQAASLAVSYNLGLAAIGLFGYIIAGIILTRRDIPVPR